MEMYCSDLYSFARRKTREVMVGNVGVGGKNPIRLQSMTTTRTMDTDATVAQSIRMIQAGCEIVRITAPTVEDAKNLKNIKRELVAKGFNQPLVADIHFLPAAAMEAAEHVEKVRINPGNYVDSKVFKVLEYTDQEYQKELDRIEEKFTPLVLKMKKLGRAMRIGTNHGSLSDRIMNRYGDSPEGMVESALEFVRICEKNGFYDIILSMKSSNPKVMIGAYRLLAARMTELGMAYPFHLGVTEAGDGEDGRIKSAIGIGSLLEDGIGDTIRVSLTEDPELEVPVCRQIAALYQNKTDTVPLPETKNLQYAENLYHYARRKTREVQIGPFKLGGENTVRLFSDFSDKKSILAVLEDQLKDSKSLAPEIIEWTVHNENDLSDFEDCKYKLFKETSRLAFYLRFADAPGQFEKGLGMAHCAAMEPKPLTDSAERKKYAADFLKDAKNFFTMAKAKGVPILLEAQVASDPERTAQYGELAPAHTLLSAVAWAESLGMGDLILSFNLPDRAQFIHNIRFAAARLAEAGKFYPFHLKVPIMQGESFDDYRVHASIALGSLLCDGIGDSVQAGTGTDPKKDLELLYNILQASGVRITKTEYVSCPSCGRTLFDLQTTTERIRSQTGHLKGVKIAIMGCIVNGPGEMADADFGYVGGAPGKINLYVGKECVQKSIPFEESDQRLIELIKAHGKWTEPA